MCSWPMSMARPSLHRSAARHDAGYAKIPLLSDGVDTDCIGPVSEFANGILRCRTFMGGGRVAHPYRRYRIERTNPRTHAVKKPLIIVGICFAAAAGGIAAWHAQGAQP